MFSSKWMRNLFGQGRKQIEAQVEAAIASGVWALSGQIELDTWQAEFFKWRTERDMKVCELCIPLEGMILTKSELTLHPRHWGCRCQILPDESG